jgi:hypothetical protein
MYLPILFNIQFVIILDLMIFFFHLFYFHVMI